MLLALLCVAQFVVVLDATIVAIALPAIQSEFGLSAPALGWVITAYTVTFGGFLLAAGRLADRFGRRRMFAAGLGLFGLASLACGLAPAGGWLFAARGVQGLGAALVTPAALAMLNDAWPDGRARSRALAWWTATAAGGGASGWVLGGLITGLVGWRWVFLINVPVCAVMALLAVRMLPGHRATGPRRLDAAGAVLGTAGLAGLVLAVTLMETRGPGDPGTLVGLAAAAGLLAGFVVCERRAVDPLLDGRLLRQRGILRANAVAAALTATTTPAMFLCILHAQQVLGLPPTTAGLLFVPFNVAVIAGSFGGPRVLARVGGPVAMGSGLAVIAAGAVSLLAISPTAQPLASMVGGMVLLGAGLGVASVASTADGTGGVPTERQGVASGVVTTSAQVGTALGLAVVVPIAAGRAAQLGGDPLAQVAGFERGFLLVAALAAVGALGAWLWRETARAAGSVRASGR